MADKLLVFISWSGKLSQAVARALHEFLPQVLQNLDPWFSTVDIHSGDRWAAEIGSKLEKSGVGIFVVTADNFERPWLNFEAGAVAKSVTSGKPMPVLFDVKDTEVTGPLAQFQMKLATREGIWDVVVALNVLLGEAGLQGERLSKAFERCWPELEKEFEKIRATTSLKPPVAPPARTAESMLEEILALLRAQPLHEPPPPVDAGVGYWHARRGPRRGRLAPPDRPETFTYAEQSMLAELADAEQRLQDRREEIVLDHLANTLPRHLYRFLWTMGRSGVASVAITQEDRDLLQHWGVLDGNKITALGLKLAQRLGAGDREGSSADGAT